MHSVLDTILGSVLSQGTGMSAGPLALCTLASLAAGVLIALFYTYRSTYSKSFVVTLALLPAIVQMVIMLVNGNLGTGVAVMGAFSLIRFRSAPGSAREISSIFLAMAAGLATGMGYLAIALLFVLLIGAVGLLYTRTKFGEPRQAENDLKITIPESLDYNGIFDDLLRTYAAKWELIEVRTANMGSLYRLHYRVVLRDASQQKQMMDELRQRNGNLEISCGRVAMGRDEL